MVIFVRNCRLISRNAGERLKFLLTDGVQLKENRGGFSVFFVGGARRFSRFDFSLCVCKNIFP